MNRTGVRLPPIPGRPPIRPQTTIPGSRSPSIGGWITTTESNVALAGVSSSAARVAWAESRSAGAAAAATRTSESARAAARAAGSAAGSGSPEQARRRVRSAPYACRFMSISTGSVLITSRAAPSPESSGRPSSRAERPAGPRSRGICFSPRNGRSFDFGRCAAFAQDEELTRATPPSLGMRVLLPASRLRTHLSLLLRPIRPHQLRRALRLAERHRLELPAGVHHRLVAVPRARGDAALAVGQDRPRLRTVLGELDHQHPAVAAGVLVAAVAGRAKR